MIRSLRKKNTDKKGFSLIELLVATALFTIVVAVSAGSFLSILEASRESRELGKLMVAVDAAMEDMSRTIRTGKSFNISLGGKKIEFNDENSNDVTYKLSADKTLVKTLQGSYSDTPITPTGITIKHLTFAETSDNPNQPRIIINIVGQLGDDSESEFYLQTSVTQRELNF